MTAAMTGPPVIFRSISALSAVLGLRHARVAALIVWRTGLRVGETVVLEWRDIDLTDGTLLVRRGKVWFMCKRRQSS